MFYSINIIDTSIYFLYILSILVVSSRGISLCLLDLLFDMFYVILNDTVLEFLFFGTEFYDLTCKQKIC